MLRKICDNERHGTTFQSLFSAGKHIRSGGVAKWRRNLARRVERNTILEGKNSISIGKREKVIAKGKGESFQQNSNGKVESNKRGILVGLSHSLIISPN